MSIVAVAGASGVGKSTFMRAFLKSVSGSTLLTSTTTRTPRTTDIVQGGAREYEYVTKERFKALAQQGVFLDTFGQEYLTQYGTRAELFERALASPLVFIAALFVPAIEIFFDEARSLHNEKNMHAVLLDLAEEEERHRRLDLAGNRGQERYEPELEKWRRAVSRSTEPFYMLDAEAAPDELVQKTIEKFSIRKEAA